MPPMLVIDDGDQPVVIQVRGPGCVIREGSVPRLSEVLYREDMAGVLLVHFSPAAVPIEVALTDRERLPAGTSVRTVPSLLGAERQGTRLDPRCEVGLGEPLYVPARRQLRVELRFRTGKERSWNQVADIRTPGAADILPGFYELGSGDIPRTWRFRVSLRGRDVSGNARCRVARVTSIFPCAEGTVLSRPPRAVDIVVDLPGGIRITGKARPAPDRDPVVLSAAEPSDAVLAGLSLAPAGCWLSIRPPVRSGNEIILHRVVAKGPGGSSS